MQLRLFLPLTLCLAACSDDKSDPTPTSTPQFTSSGAEQGDGSDDGEAATGTTTTAAPTTDAPGDDTTTGIDATTAGPTTDEPTSAGPVDTGDDTTDTGDDTTGPVQTDGPGLLPGESGLEGSCRRYVECGGTYYADQQECMDASLNYWGDCPSRRAALDEFGACMSEIECSDYDPDSYNPNSTPCAEQWGDLGASEPCN